MSHTVLVRQVVSLLTITSLAVAPAVGAQRGGGAAVIDPNAASITDPRVGLHPGMTDAGVASKNMELQAGTCLAENNDFRVIYTVTS